MAPGLTWWTRVADAVRAAGRGEAPIAEPVRMLRDGLGYDCATLIGRQPANRAPQPILVNLDYPTATADFVASTYARECPAHRYALQRHIAVRFVDLPFDFRDSRTYQEALRPCGFREGLTLPLGGIDATGRRPGFIAMSSTHGRPLGDDDRLALTLFASEIAGLTAPQIRPDADPADLVVYLAGGRAEVRLGDPSQSPFDAAAMTRLAVLHARSTGALRFRRRGADGQWWSVRTDAVADGVLLCLWRTGTPEGLTPRELDVAGLASRGWSNDRIAEALGISVRTARAHIESVLAKLGAANRTELARIAYGRELDSLDAIRCEIG
ncbi:LuxR C-terminal-related transcriptional regulator [Gordonia sp. (in: high G+C Gram-positive bacteria)]|uniref:LuxR C-terminal-related transcriptional regulator n=1 Tax=unclassified Gordonia (in: high G+C Gram-positive bacteria) TaxID=2657482 RepID=UPI002614394E|nr:LuxR C-terminal-related transcriptional regulator [Gordonia sp. (in: high G+C Gram-positive bacteria)]